MVNLLIMVAMIQIFFACREQDEIYREYVTEGGVVYPGKPAAVAKNRIGAVEIEWPNNTVTVTEARIWWNNYADSVVIPITAEMDTVRRRITLPVEGVYSFFIRTYDRYGNASVEVEVTGRSMGEKYLENNYFNRMTTGYKTTGGNNLKIEWDVADTEAGALYCDLFYTSSVGGGTEKTVRVPASETATVLDDWKAGTSLRYNTVYKPDPEDPMELTTSFREQKGFYALLDNKSPSRVVAFSSQYNDAAGQAARNAYDGVIDKNRWHSAAGGYPHYIVIDLGEVFDIARFDVWPSNYDGPLDNRMPSRLRWEVSDGNNLPGNRDIILGNSTGAEQLSGGSFGMKFTAGQAFASFTVRCPSWSTSNSSLTLSLYKWEGSWNASVAGQPLASQRFENYADNSNLTVNGSAKFPAGDYLWVAGDGVNSAGVYTGDVVAGTQAFKNGSTVSRSYDSYVSYNGWSSLGEYDYAYTEYPYRYNYIPQTAGRFFKLTGLNDPAGNGIMCLAEIDVYIKSGD
jgi:hypothetical protein